MTEGDRNQLVVGATIATLLGVGVSYIASRTLSGDSEMSLLAPASVGIVGLGSILYLTK